MKKISQTGIRAENIRSIFRVMLSSDAPVSRSEIAEKTGLSLMTVGKVADHMISEGIVTQSKPVTGSAGRRAGKLELTRKHFLLVANISDTVYTSTALDMRLKEIDRISYRYSDSLSCEDNLMIFFRETSTFLLGLLPTHRLAGTGICTGGSGDKANSAPDAEKIMKGALGFSADIITDCLSASVRSRTAELPPELRECTLHLVLDSALSGCVASDGKKISSDSDFASLRCENGKTLLRTFEEETDEEALAAQLCYALKPVLRVLSPRALLVDSSSRVFTEWFPDILRRELHSVSPETVLFFDRESESQSDIGTAKILRRDWIERLASPGK